MDSQRIETLKLRGYEEEDISKIAQFADSNGITQQGSLDTAIQGAGFSLDLEEYKKSVAARKKTEEESKTGASTETTSAVKAETSGSTGTSKNTTTGKK